MRHFNDDELVLLYYGESGSAGAIERHLQSCPRCASSYEAIARTLGRISAPEIPEPGEEFRADLVERIRHRVLQDDRPWWASREETILRDMSLAALVWIVPLLYPFSFPAIFNSTRLAREHPAIGIPFVLLALMWALAGPVVAVFALNGIQGSHLDRMRQRLVVCGALVATISPALFNLTSRTGLGLPMWYGAAALGAIIALLPIPESSGSTEGLRRVHRLSALLIFVFAVAHISNQAFAIVSTPTHTTVQNVLRVIYRQRVIELLLIAAIALQVVTGATMWRAKVGRASASANLQAVSGLYLAAFFLAHVSAVLLARQQHTETDFVWAAGRTGLLASPGLASLLPYYLLGIAALFAHVGAYAGAKAARFMPELSVRRLSYAAIAFGGTMVLTIGLALCGVRLIP